MILLHKEIEKSKRQLLTLGALVEDRVALAVKAMSARDAKTAQAIIDGDTQVDSLEVDAEEECLKILALYQPVAIDLRMIVAVLKINSDLERIGDLAVAIAERAVALSELPDIPSPFDFPAMSARVQDMLRKSLDALVNLDETVAKAVCALDDQVDLINRQMYRTVETELRQHPEHIAQLLGYLSVSRYLERIADHATNIAEDVMYLVGGAIVRHRSDLTHPASAV